MFKYLILFFSALSFGQTFNFTVLNENGALIDNCNILFREKQTNSILEFTKINNGKGAYSLIKSYIFLEIIVQSVGYNDEFVLVENLVKDRKYSLNFILKSKEIMIKEVIVEIKKLPFLIKKDTVTYDVSKYRDGSEKKVEDLLKKLPGIEVDVNGSIMYKGKQLETVTLDGDNLFNSNYKLGTKNINIDMVEQVEAIDNYNKNVLLKGIESDGKVSLNLKLIKGKSDYSGNFENALGLKNNLNMALYSNSYIMQISSKVKTFGLLNINNIGRSDSYFYEKQDNKSLDRKSEDDFKTKKLFSDDLFSPQIDPIRYNVNNQFYLSYNNLFKINKRLSLKSNLNFINDKINSNQNVNTTNFIDSFLIETSDYYSSIKKPKVLTGEFELKYNLSSSALIEGFFKQYFEKTNVLSDYIKNNQFGYTNFNETKSYFSINKIVHTWKVSNNKALQANLYYSYNDIPQTFKSSNLIENIKQESEFKKSSWYFNYNLIGKNKNFSYSVQIGSGFEKTPYFSENSTDFNKTIFKNDYYFSHTRVKYFFKKVTFIPNISLTNYRLSLENRIPIGNSYSNSLLFEPSLDIIFKNRKSTFTVSYSNTQKPISDEHIFTNNVLVNNRTIILNQPTFDFQKINNFLISYYYNNLYTNTTINISSHYQKSNGQYLSNFSINENYSTIINSFYYKENSSFNSSIRISKFIEKLALNLIYSSSYIKNEYPNFINNSDIRKNTYQTFKNTIEIRTGFNSKINFENSLSHKVLESKSVIVNNNYSLQNSFKIRYKINKKCKTSLKWDFFSPNLMNKSNSYDFVDFELNYKLNNKINFTLAGNNLLNIEYFNQIENNDFSSFVSKTNLTQQLFLLNMEYSF